MFEIFEIICWSLLYFVVVFLIVEIFLNERSDLLRVFKNW